MRNRCFHAAVGRILANGNGICKRGCESPTPRRISGNACASLPVPFFRDAPGACAPVQDGKRGLTNAVRVGTGQNIRSYLAGDGTLRILPQREAWDAQNGGLFLNSAAVR